MWPDEGLKIYLVYSAKNTIYELTISTKSIDLTVNIAIGHGNFSSGW